MNSIHGSEDRIDTTLEAIRSSTQKAQDRSLAVQVESKQALFEEEETGNPLITLKKQESIKDRIVVTKKEQAKEAGETIPIEEVQSAAKEFAEGHEEHNAASLALLRTGLKNEDKKEDILKRVKEFYSDPYLMNEALQFLLKTTSGNLNQEVQKAIDDFQKEYSKEISSSTNIDAVASQAVKEGLGTRSEFRKTYIKYITEPPQDAVTKFEELSKKYTFDQLTPLVNNLLHALGQDMKKSSVIKPDSRGEFSRLIGETRALQAVLGVYRFFKGRMGLVESMFNREK